MEHNRARSTPKWKQKALLSAITNTSPIDNEFFIKGSRVFFCGIYEDMLLKGVSPADFHCWHYWGKSSSSCYMGGIRLRGADAASFQYYVNRKINAADRKSFRLYTPLTAPSFCDLLARDDNNCYINDEIIDESYWLDRLKRVKDECMSE